MTSKKWFFCQNCHYLRNAISTHLWLWNAWRWWHL